MLNRRLVLSAALLTLLMPLPSYAAGTPDFTLAAFKAAQKSGKTVLIEVHAGWCPTCKAQKPIIDADLANPEFKNVASFRVDFDSQKADVKAFGAQTQSTLIVYKGEKETGRSVGDTNPISIKALLASGL